MTTYLKIAMLISLLILQVPITESFTPKLRVHEFATFQNMLSVHGEETLQPDVFGTALAEY